MKNEQEISEIRLTRHWEERSDPTKYAESRVNFRTFNYPKGWSCKKLVKMTKSGSRWTETKPGELLSLENYATEAVLKGTQNYDSEEEAEKSFRDRIAIALEAVLNSEYLKKVLFIENGKETEKTVIFKIARIVIECNGKFFSPIFDTGTKTSGELGGMGCVIWGVASKNPPTKEEKQKGITFFFREENDGIPIMQEFRKSSPQGCVYANLFRKGNEKENEILVNTVEKASEIGPAKCIIIRETFTKDSVEAQLVGENRLTSLIYRKNNLGMKNVKTFESFLAESEETLEENIFVGFSEDLDESMVGNVINFFTGFESSAEKKAAANKFFEAIKKAEEAVKADPDKFPSGYAKNWDQIKAYLIGQATENGFKGGLVARKSPKDSKSKHAGKVFIQYEKGVTGFQALVGSAGSAKSSGVGIL